MLIDEPEIMTTDPMLAIIAHVNGRSPETVRLETGIYEIGHFGSSHFLPGYEHYPQVTTGPYGVADSVQQILDANPELRDPDRKFLVTVNRLRRSEQPEEGGWRWHKWGEYIGTREPRCEYLYDEPEIEEVLVFHIYERR